MNAGWGKHDLDRDRAAGLQAMAARVIPPVSRIDAAKFGKILSYAEMTLGVALLTPFVPSRLAGLGLGAALILDPKPQAKATERITAIEGTTS